MSGLTERLRSFEQHWTSGRRVVAPAGLLAVISALALSTLVAAAADDPSRPRTVAHRHHSPPQYLLPIGALIREGWLPGPTLRGDLGSVGVPAGTPKPPAEPDPGRAAQQAPAIAPFRGLDGTITPAGLATLALEAGCAPGPAVTATAIAMAESGGSPSAQGDLGLMDSVWDWSAGLWQIRGLRSERGTGGLRDSVANQAVSNNAAAMHAISQGCTDWTPWSTYNTGAYAQFLALARSAVTYVVRWFNAHGHHYPPVPAPDPNATIPSGGGGAGQPGAVAARNSSRATPSAHRPRKPTHRASGAGGAQPAPAASSSAPAGGGPAPVPTSAVKQAPLPLATTSLPRLPSPSLSVPQLPLPTLSVPKLP